MSDDEEPPAEDDPAEDGAADGDPAEGESADGAPAAAESGDEDPAEAGSGNEDPAEADSADEDPAEADSTDEDPAEADSTDEESTDDGSTDEEPSGTDPVTVETLRERLSALEERLADAETEADLDAVEAELTVLEADVEEADLPEEADDEEGDGDEDEDGAVPPEEAVETLREELTEARGPYAEDVTEAIAEAEGTVESTEWTKDGEADLLAAVESFLEAAGEALDRTFVVEGEDPAGLAETLSSVAAVVADAGLDPDDDAGTIADLLEATDALAEGVEAAEEWDDLSVREKLAAHGFYDVLEHRKDFPPEWHALKIFERDFQPEKILVALDLMDSDFMERHCVEALRRLGPEEALDAMTQRAQRRDKAAVEVLGKIGSDEPVEMLLEYAEADSDPQLQKTTLKALGEIGSREATQTVADRLANDDPEIRSAAARSLGLIGDTRAVEPLADALADDEADTVRASAAWALVQIGTERAFEEVRAYADDPSYLVQAEAEKAPEPAAEPAD